MSSESWSLSHGPSTGTVEAARIMDGCFDEIFSDYKRRLEDMGSLLVVGEGVATDRLESNARSILGRTSRILRGEEESLLAVEEEIYRNIATDDEPLNPHPDETLRAGVALCKATVLTVVGHLPDGRSEVEASEVAVVSLAVQEIVMDRVTRLVMSSYVDFLLTKVRETQFEERRRFSRDLHDRMAHQMTVVSQSLDLFDHLRLSDPDRAETRLALARKTTDDALAGMRDLSYTLRSEEASDGLRIALENLVRISVPEGVDCQIVFEGEENDIPDTVRDQLYLILREGLRNAVAHSGSEEILIEVSVYPDFLIAAILDRGVGREAPGSYGVGLDSMEERTSLLDGSFRLEEIPDGGTRAEVRIPLPKEG